MANIKSAKKRIKVIAKKTLRNKMIKSQTKTAIKKFVIAAKTGTKEIVKPVFLDAISAIDKARSKGIFHKNTAARKKSSLSKINNKLS